MHTVNLLTHLVEHHQILAYVVIYVGLIFEGEFIIISTGILAHLGALNLWVSLIFIFCGGLSKTFLGYAFGKFLHKKFNSNKLFKHIERRVYNVMPHFEHKPFWSIFLSKFLMINHIVIVFSGYKRIDFKKYLQAEISATLLWAPGLLLLGYFFSYTALHISREIWKFSMIVLILFIMFFLLDKLAGWIYELFEEFYDDQ